MASGSSVDEPFERGLELARAGRYFDAHEELELAWRAAHEADRDFFQGLVHVVVAWYQAGRGNRPGCERQLQKAARRLARYAPAHRGVSVESVLTDVDRARAAVANGSLELGEPESLQHARHGDAQPPVAIEEEQQPERD